MQKCYHATDRKSNNLNNKNKSMNRDKKNNNFQIKVYSDLL